MKKTIKKSKKNIFDTMEKHPEKEVKIKPIGFLLEYDTREIEVLIQRGKITLASDENLKNTGDNECFGFVESKPETVRAIGKMFIKAAEMARGKE